MTTWQSLLYCSAADVTLERMKALIGITGTESLTVEFKRDGSTLRIAESAAAMANTYGGLVLVGVTDEDREIVGVPREVITNVASTFATTWILLTGCLTCARSRWMTSGNVRAGDPGQPRCCSSPDLRPEKRQPHLLGSYPDAGWDPAGYP